MKNKEYLKQEIKILIDKYKKIELSSFENYPKIYQSIEFIVNLLEKYNEIIDKYINSNVMYSNYREITQEPKERINYFKENYIKNDYEEQLELFIIFNILEESKIMYEYFDVFTNEEIETQTPIEYIETFKELQNKKKVDDLEFLKNGEFKIMFTGLCDDDIPLLPPMIKNIMLRTIESDLTKNDKIVGQDMISSIKDKYDLDFKRIHISKDYRLTFYRNKNVTAMLGITYKSGHDQDYSRYRSFAANINKINEEIDKFILKNTSNPKHNMVVEDLYKFIKKQSKNY